MQLNIDDTVTREFGKAGEFTVDLAAMPEASLAYIFAYGLKQVLTDAHSAAKSASEARGMTQKKLDALMRGEFRAASGRTSDPIKAEAKRLARLALEAALKAKGQKATKEAIAKAIEALVPRYMEQAKANVEAASALAGEIDLAGLV